jgi:hypothetical protein
VAADLPASFPVEVENPLGVGVGFLARLGEQNPTAPASEQGHPRRLLQGVNPLAHRRLGHPQRLASAGEVAQLGRLRERLQVRKLLSFGMVGVHRTSTFPPFRCRATDINPNHGGPDDRR